jgi:predicted  nucleic acid-binding Zn-ribbon protein
MKKKTSSRVPESGTVQALDKQIAELSDKLSKLKRERKEVKGREGVLTPSQLNLLRSKSKRKIEKDLVWLTSRLTDMKTKAKMGSKAERGWAAQQMAPLRVKITDAVQVLRYLADTRKEQPQDGRQRKPPPADNIETLTVAQELPMPDGSKEWFIPGQTVHTQGHPGYERVVDFYYVAAIVNKRKMLNRWVKYWWDSVTMQCQLQKRLQAAGADAQRWEHNCSQVQIRLEAALQDIQHLKEEVREVRYEMGDVYDDNAELYDRNVELSTQIKSLQCQEKEIRYEMGGVYDRNAELQAQIELLQRQEREIRYEMGGVYDCNAMLRTEVAKLRGAPLPNISGFQAVKEALQDLQHQAGRQDRPKRRHKRQNK